MVVRRILHAVAVSERALLAIDLARTVGASVAQTVGVSDRCPAFWHSWRPGGHGSGLVTQFPLTLNVQSPPAEPSAAPFLEDALRRARLNCATPRSTLRSLVHMKRPLRFLLGQGLSRTAWGGDTAEDEDVRRWSGSDGSTRTYMTLL